MSLFITFEGCEGSGKSTQIAMLSQYLQDSGVDVLITREPGGTEIAEKIRRIILEEKGIEDIITETLLINAARRDHLNYKIMPALKMGKIVICDRFSDSTMVYQGYVKGLDTKTLSLINSLATNDFQPDYTFLLDIDPNESLNRINDKQRSNNFYDLKPISFHLKIRKGFLEIAANNPERVIVINGSGSMSDIHANIIKKLNFKI